MEQILAILFLIVAFLIVFVPVWLFFVALVIAVTKYTRFYDEPEE